MLPNSLPAWKLDKILPRSRWPQVLNSVGWLLALIAILLSGLSWIWQVFLAFSALLMLLISWRRASPIHAISVSPQACTLRFEKRASITLNPPYRATPLIWWISLQHKEGFVTHWFTLYRDQFSDAEWRQLMVLLRWSPKEKTHASH